eukprot:COSAG02_NODE_7821_length_2791_cov_2.697147_2_plen_159_part_00
MVTFVCPTTGSSICGLFALFQMAAMEAALTPADCDGTLLLPTSSCDLDDRDCIDGNSTTRDCATLFEDRVENQGMDAKDNATCPDECDFSDDTLTAEQAMAMFLVAAAGCLCFYSAWMLVRCCVFGKHRREALREEMREEMARKRKSGGLSRKNVASM